MPHIKVKPFKTNVLSELIERDGYFVFHAVGSKSQAEMLGVEFDDEQFMLEIKRTNDLYLIKSDTVSRPLDSDKVKKILAHLIDVLDLDVLHSNIAIQRHKPALANRYNKKIDDFEDPVFTREKLAIEVGFGSGRHLLHQAKNNPDTLFIGIEIHTPSAQQVLKQIALQKLDNIWIVNYDARLLLEMMPSNSCTHIYVHFPVPWDKKPHRRVISERFVDESLRVLAPNGELELRTDSDNYYTHALETFKKFGRVDLKIRKNEDIEISSKYEDRWKIQEKDIYTITVCNKEISKERKRSYDFDFKKNGRIANLAKLPEQALVKELFFIHFEKKYKIVGSDDMIVRCAFGSFDRPEHKYLIQNGNTVGYYPQNPVKTEVNFHAHQYMGEFIYG